MNQGLLVALGSMPAEPAVVTALEEAGLTVVRRCVDVADLMATASSRQASVALVSADLVGLDAEVVDHVQRTGQAVVGVCVGGASADEAALRALGVSEVATADDLATLIELVTTAGEQQPAGRESGSPPRNADAMPARVADAMPGKVVAVWGPTGAPGRSTVAMGISSVLAQAGYQSFLIDADVYGGATAIQLGVLDEASGLLAAARAANTGTLRPGVLASSARSVVPSMRVLTGLPSADRWTEVRATLMGRVVECARQLADLVVVDCGFSLELDEELMYDTSAPRRNGATIDVLERSDVTLVIGTADPVGLSRLIRAVHELSVVVPAARPVVVVNRVRTSLGWSTQEIDSTIRRALGPVPIAFLPDDPSAVDRSLVQAKTLTECAPDAKLTRALWELASLVTSRDLDESSSGRRPVRDRRGRRRLPTRTRRAARAR